ncbi:MAG: hypothetical protein LBE13_14560, partial [Bacteroidales bacterium]|nr:hypothetical protein [Bacteroidales bacterium]
MNKSYFSIDVRILNFATFIVLFFPQFQSYFGLLFEQLLSILICAISFALFIIDNRSIVKMSSLYISIIFILLLLVSLARSLNIFIINDIYELAKPVYFFCFFVLAYNVRWNDTKLCYYINRLIILLFVSALIGIGESVIPAFDSVTRFLYKGSREVVFKKAIFSFISPYTFGTLLFFPVFYYIIKMINKKTRTIISDLLLLLIFFLCLLFTQSRTVFLSFIITFFILMVIILFNKWYPSRQKILIWFSAVVVFFINSIPLIVIFIRSKFDYLYIGLDTFFKSLKQFSISDIERVIMLNHTMAIRYRQLLFAISHQDTIPVVGIGIGKAVLMPESFYAMYYYRVGLIGTGIHFGLIFYSI